MPKVKIGGSIVPEWRNGRRCGLKIRCLRAYGFESRLRHHVSKRISFLVIKTRRQTP